MQGPEPRFEVLDGLPPYGPRAEPFPVTGERSHREGFVVRFFPHDGEPWVGNFQGDGSTFCSVKPHPDGRRLVVISRGEAYILDPCNRQAVEEIGGCYDDAITIGELLVLSTGTDLRAIGREGVRWRTKRISWDGIRNLRLDSNGGVIEGEAWSPFGDDWTPFEVDLHSGAVKGGSYLEQ